MADNTLTRPHTIIPTARLRELAVAITASSTKSRSLFSSRLLFKISSLSMRQASQTVLPSLLGIFIIAPPSKLVNTFCKVFFASHHFPGTGDNRRQAKRSTPRRRGWTAASQWQDTSASTNRGIPVVKPHAPEGFTPGCCIGRPRRAAPQGRASR